MPLPSKVTDLIPLLGLIPHPENGFFVGKIFFYTEVLQDTLNLFYWLHKVPKERVIGSTK
jgi:hypothetical protein